MTLIMCNRCSFILRSRNMLVYVEIGNEKKKSSLCHILQIEGQEGETWCEIRFVAKLKFVFSFFKLKLRDFCT